MSFPSCGHGNFPDADQGAHRTAPSVGASAHGIDFTRYSWDPIHKARTGASPPQCGVSLAVVTFATSAEECLCRRYDAPVVPSYPLRESTDYNGRHHGNSRRSHRRRRHRRRQHRLAPHRTGLPQRAHRRARNASGQRLDRQEHGRGARAIRHRAQHSDVDVLHPVLCRVRRAARVSPGDTVRRDICSSPRRRSTSTTFSPTRTCSIRWD